MAYTKNVSNPISEFKLKEQMCDIGRRIWLKGFCAGNEGNHSYRIGENRILCTPTGISKGNLKPDDLCVVDMEGKQLAGKRKRTSEILMHLQIYKARPDVKAVIHSHPPHATAFAVAGVELPTCIHPEAEVFLGAVKTAKYVTPGDKRLGESLLPFVKDSNTILLESHGVVCFSPDLEQAYYQLEIVDAYARILLLTKQVGSIRPLDGGEMKELLELKNRFGLKDARFDAGLSNMTCANDFLSRVGDIVTKGKMATASGGTVPSPANSTYATQTPSGIEKAIGALAPQNYSEKDIDQLVQVITDQIMAKA
ncbi:MAG TPA: class II aldolase/adducin family protein [Tepidisphaeraceae bacterium]|jgi:L-fuculose-phosphate aldolase|nr:class II aldolase/adducin family protein [Tepidisphaeraceae bacterium]